MAELTFFSPAKINLFLHITGRRDDGYHNLQSVFRALDFGDTLTFRPKTGGDLITLLGDNLPCEQQDNLIVKAAQLLAKKFPAYASSVSVVLDKVIPVGGGLGGGSSNCAMTLIALNQLWGLHLTPKELMKIGATLGADVPFFIFAHAYQTDAIALGIGDELTAINLPSREYLLLFPDESINTAELFSNKDLIKNTPIISELTAKIPNFLDLQNPPFFNAFETIVCEKYQKVNQALSYLRTFESATQTTARMSGTGSTVYLPLIGLGKNQVEFINYPCPAVLVNSLYG